MGSLLDGQTASGQSAGELPAVNQAGIGPEGSDWWEEQPWHLARVVRLPADVPSDGPIETDDDRVVWVLFERLQSDEPLLARVVLLKDQADGLQVLFEVCTELGDQRRWALVHSGGEVKVTSIDDQSLLDEAVRRQLASRPGPRWIADELDGGLSLALSRGLEL